MVERTHHAVTIDGASVKEGENSFPCTLHTGEHITLVWDGRAFSLREEEASDPAFGEVTITYVDDMPPAPKGA